MKSEEKDRFIQRDLQLLGEMLTALDSVPPSAPKTKIERKIQNMIAHRLRQLQPQGVSI